MIRFDTSYATLDALRFEEDYTLSKKGEVALTFASKLREEESPRVFVLTHDQVRQLKEFLNQEEV